MRKAMLTMGLLLLPALVLAATTVAVSEHPEVLSTRVVESDITRTVLEYEIGSFTRTPMEIDGETFYSIELGSESPFKETGLPQLPNVSRSIVIPDNAEMAVRVVASHYTDFPNLPVAPSKGIITRDIDPATVAYSFDSFYGTDGWYPTELVSAREPYIMRDVRGMVVVVNSFQYNAATQTLRVYDRVVVEVEQVGAAKVNPLISRPATMNREFKSIYERHFLNFGADSDRYPPVDDDGNMLVICYDDPAFLTAMQPLVEWKNQMGVPCEMVTTTDAGGSATAIDAYIAQYYNDHGLTYVLLVGDAAQVPTLSASGGSSDPEYSTITPDMYPELFVGRFSAESAGQVETQVLRTIEYEKRPQTAADWYHKGMGVASNQGPGDDGEYDDEHLDNIRADLLAFTYTEVDQIYDPSGTATMVTNGLNDGRSVINYTGHGSTTSWSSTGFSNTHVNALVNDNMLPFIVSVACVNGQFSGYTCFGEAWLRASNGGEPTGAIGAYMSSINQSWDPPMDAQDEIVDLLVGTAVEGARRTYGGLCYNGSSHMMDEYGTGGEDMFLTWHIFGDPSLRVRTDTPAPVTVNHISVIYPSMTDFAVEVVGVEDALCALYGDGVLYGSALTDATGNATVPIGTMPTPGTFITLTVTAFNTETYTADIPVVVPVTYDISPATIPVGATTPVTITVWDNGGAPLPDVEITVDGWGIAAQLDVTDGAGQAHFSLTPPYGEDLAVVASEIGESYNCFEDVIPVTGAAALTSPDIDASVASIGLYGSLAPHYEGSITGTAGGTGLVLYALGCGIDASAGPSGGSTVEILATPTSTGTVSAALARTGYNVYLEDVAVNVVYGQLAGTVYDVAMAPISGAVVKGYPAGSDTTGATPTFQAVSGGGGAYDMGIDIGVGYYDVYISKFGYLTAAPEVFVQYGTNVEDFVLDAAPSGVVSGTITESGTGTPLEATVKIYRSDDMSLYTETTSDPGTGDYSVTLPYFNYQMNVRAYHHIPENRGISVGTPAMTEDFVLDETLANILVISDGVRGEQESHKVDKAGNAIDWSGDSDLGRSASQIATDLVALGYDVTEETAAGSDPATWLPNYDFILSASGDNTAPVEVQSYRDALEVYVAAGGKLLIEGGEVAYDAVSYPGYPTFAANVLHSADWNADSAGNLTVADPTHPVTTFPNTIGTITFSYANYGDQDASVPTTDAMTVCSWTSNPSDASVIVYDDTPNPISGQIVFFQFDYLAGEASGMMALLENTVTYLVTPESAPDGSISGTVTLDGMTNHAGVTVTMQPGGETDVTDLAGAYSFDGLYDGVYTVTATKADWSTDMVEDIAVSGGPVTGVDMTLYPLQIVEHCSTPAVAIPDSDPVGVNDYITFAETVDVTEVEIYVDITHPTIAELIVEVTSPEGTTVRLHDRSGVFNDDIIGWYDSELVVDGPGDLPEFAGEDAQGVWTLTVSDNAGDMYLGTLNEWCVHIVGGGPQTGVEDDLGSPMTFVLRGISPNPFNPMTAVSYGSPTEAHVRLAVYNVAGRLVRTLVDREVDPGYHSVVWDGRDDRGVEVGSGVYFCRMEAQGFSDATKMVLLK